MQHILGSIFSCHAEARFIVIMSNVQIYPLIYRNAVDPMFNTRNMYTYLLNGPTNQNKNNLNKWWIIVLYCAL